MYGYRLEKILSEDHILPSRGLRIDDIVIMRQIFLSHPHTNDGFFFLLTGMRKLRIDQDFLIEHWHMIYRTGCPPVREKSGKFSFSSRSGKSQGIL